MNVTKVLSLFFLITIFTGTGNLLAQERDSISYWSKLILNPKEERDLIDGYSFFDNLKEKSLESKDTLNAVYSLSMLSIADFDLDLLYDSEKDAIQALELLDKIEVSAWKYQMTTSLYNSLGKTHRALGDYEEAHNSYDKVLKLTNLLNDSVRAYNNIGNIYKDKKEYDKALIQFELGYRASLRNTDSIENARILDNLGYTQSKLGDTKGFEKMSEALKIRMLKNDSKGIFANYLNYTEYYDEQNQRDSALFYAIKLYELSKNYDGLKYREQALSNLLKLDKKAQYQEYIALVDSLRIKKLKQGVAYSHRKYDVAKERQIALAEKLKSDEEKKVQRLLFIGLGLLLLVSAVFVFFLLKLKYRKAKTKEVIKETYQTERRLSKKVHDELANDLSDTLNLIDSHKAIPTTIKTQLVNKIDDLYDRTRDISAEIGGFDTKDFAKSLKFLITQHNIGGVKVITNVMSGINWDLISDHKKINIYRGLQELLVNMKKHSKANRVSVIFKSEGKRHFINYTDDGVGFDLHDVRIRGLQNVETRIKNIQGSITFKTSKGKGFKAHLYF